MTRTKSDLVVGARIRQARLARGKSMQELADGIGVSRQMVSKYELGLSSPTPEVFWRIRDDLNMPNDYFLRSLPTTNTASPLFFRSLKSSTAQLKLMVEKRMEWLDEVLEYLNHFLTFPTVNLPDLKKFSHVAQWSAQDIEDLANHARQSWGLGLGPISNITRLVENNGILVSRISFDDHRVDACSQIRQQRSIIMLGNESLSAVRLRFDVAHELGHLLMHSDLDPGDIDSATLDRLESEAHHFARAFLLPETSFQTEVLRPTLANLQILKPRWKVSIKMMIGRLRDLGIVDESSARSLYKQYNAKRWMRQEPLDDEMPHEESSTLSHGVTLLFEHKVKRPGSILSELPIPPDELECLLGLDKGALTAGDSPMIGLKLVK